MNALISSRPASDASTPARIESAPSVGPIVCSCRYVSVAGSAPDRRMSARFCASSCVKPPAIWPSAGDAPVDARRRLHRLVEHDREEAPDVLAGDARERRGARRVQREADRRHVVLVELHARAAQILAGHRRHAANEVVGRPAGRPHRPAPSALPCPAARRRRWLRSRSSRLAAGPCSTSFSSSMPGDPMTSFRAIDVGHARQLHQNLIGALLRDARLGDAELVHAALDRLPRLHDRFLAKPSARCSAASGTCSCRSCRGCARSRRLPARRPGGTPAPAPAARRRRGTSSRPTIATVAGTPRRFSSSCRRPLSCSVFTRSASSVWTRSTRCTPPLRSSPSFSCRSRSHCGAGRL